MNRARMVLLAAAIASFSIWHPHPALGTSVEDRQVTAMFRPGMIQLPSGVDSGTVSQSQVTPTIVSSALSTLGVEMITRAFPDFSLADTLWVSPAGDSLKMTNWADVYKLRVQEGAYPESLAAALQHIDGVGFVDLPTQLSFGGFVYPTDSLFVSGSQWPLWNTGQNGGTADADIDAPEAWGTTVGDSSQFAGKIGIIDTGVSNTHEDLQGRVVGDPPDPDDAIGHGSLVAGVIGARAMNHVGIAGVDWKRTMYSKDVRPCSTSPSCFANAMREVMNGTNSTVFNCSWVSTDRDGSTPLYSTDLRLAMRDLYVRGNTIVAEMGNTSNSQTQWPAAFGQGIIAVGGIDRNNQPYSLGTTGQHMDVCAPALDIMTTNANGGYSVVQGNSFSTAYVSGIASLLLSVKNTAGPDAIKNILRLSADHLGTSGHNATFGWGRVNAQRAIQLLRAPNLYRPHLGNLSVGSAYAYGTPTTTTMTFYNVGGLTNGRPYSVHRQEVHEDISFTPPFQRVPEVWGNGPGTSGQSSPNGFSTDNPNFGIGWCEPFTVAVDMCTVRTYAYEVYKDDEPTGPRWIWYPSTPSAHYGVLCSVDALEIAPIPDVSQSFYVPQAGTTTTPLEGLSSPNPSYRFFRACPNNDGGASLPNNARIKVVAKDAAGNGLPGIQRGDIFVLLNGGTPEQGFVGDGADSVIANSAFNSSPLCPDVRAFEADDSTDASGVAYITFTGSTPGSPGVGTRDPNRNWGHYDSELPVYVLGKKISGRLTTGSASGSYVLRIKNFDYTGVGLHTAPNQGEAVTSSDVNSVAVNIGVDNTISYWRDFDWTCLEGGGPDCVHAVGVSDFNMINLHVGHNCATPMNP